MLLLLLSGCLKFPEKQKDSRSKLHSDLKISVSNIIKTNKMMKKFLFSALAFVAFAGSGFASNEVVYDEQNLKTEISVDLDIVDNAKKPCSYTIKGTDAHGRPFHTRWTVQGDVTSADCDDAKNNRVALLERQGSTIESTSTHWG